jgi:hypothetical protein
LKPLARQGQRNDQSAGKFILSGLFPARVAVGVSLIIHAVPYLSGNPVPLMVPSAAPCEGVRLYAIMYPGYRCRWHLYGRYPR